MKVNWPFSPFKVGKTKADSQDVASDNEDAESVDEDVASDDEDVASDDEDVASDDEDVTNDKENIYSGETEAKLKFKFEGNYVNDFYDRTVLNALLELSFFDVESAIDRAFVGTVEDILVSEPFDVEIKITYFNEFESKDGITSMKTKVFPGKIHYANNKPAIDIFQDGEGAHYAEIPIFFRSRRIRSLFSHLLYNEYLPLVLYPGQTNFQNQTDSRLFEMVLTDKK